MLKVLTKAEILIKYTAVGVGQKLIDLSDILDVGAKSSVSQQLARAVCPWGWGNCQNL